MRGVLVREIPIRLLDLSMSGCQVGASRAVEEGIAGELRVVLDGKRYQDFVRVVRHHGYHGSSFPCVLGSRFASTHRAGTPSVRGTVPCGELDPPA